ncbi:hypothetical protein Ddye_006722 [Dipteronia dyeriana]|uniref:Uncharacterized protein n=1 Tax=Dipteronia dyeriana TaxID=168575 RepID=A0AAE0CQZ3_9ROSI|nr:hypothetical protein Ddye_006722 [Dipteronia dyeriana]
MELYGACPITTNSGRGETPDLLFASDNYRIRSDMWSSTVVDVGSGPRKSKYFGTPIKRKGDFLSRPRFLKTPRKLNIHSSSRGTDSERTSNDPPSSVIPNTFSLISLYVLESVRANASSAKVQEIVSSDPPENLQVSEAVCPSVFFSNFFKGERSRPSVPTIGDILSDSDPSFALKQALAGDLTFGPPEDYEAFEVTDIVEHGRQGVHFLHMLLRKCNSTVKEKDGLIAQVSRMAEEKQKLLVENSKLLTKNSKLMTRISYLTSKETTIVEETRIREVVERRVAELEKENGILELHLEEFKSDFESARDEIEI